MLVERAISRVANSVCERLERTLGESVCEGPIDKSFQNSSLLQPGQGAIGIRERALRFRGKGFCAKGP